MRELTAESVKQLYDVMTQYYDVELIEHWNGSVETQMGVLTLYLGALGVKDIPRALETYTFSMWDEIYLPFKPGHNDELDGNPLIFQVATCASVLQRVLHARECDRPNEGHLLYLLSPVSRAYAEIAAVRALYEVYQWYFAVYPAEQAGWGMGDNSGCLLTGWFPAHGCTDIAIELTDAKRRFQDITSSDPQDGIWSPAAKDVIHFFGWDEVTVR